MPMQGFICHVTGDRVAPETCLTCSQAGGLEAEDGLFCPFAPPIIKGLIESNQPRDLMGYSATELAGCPRGVILKEREAYHVKPAQAYWAFRGQLAHGIVERAERDHAQVIVEQRYFATLNGILLTGQPDVVYTDRGLLVDYKTTKQVPQTRKQYTCPECGTGLRCTQWQARKGSKLDCEPCERTYRAGDELEPTVLPPVPYDGHSQQLNIYRWLLAQNGIEVDAAEVVYLSMAEVLRLPVPLWEFAYTETVMQQGLDGLLEAGPDGLPSGVQDDPGRNWECRYCPVFGACQRYAEEAERAQSQGVVEAIEALYPV